MESFTLAQRPDLNAEFEALDADVSFDHAGAHVVPGALVPVEIDLESDTGTYVEPSVWYLHSLT
jgi:hypothetical protein